MLQKFRCIGGQIVRSCPIISDNYKGLQAAQDAKQESDKGRATKGEPERMQEHTTTGKGSNTKKPAYICMIAGDEKKV